MAKSWPESQLSRHELLLVVSRCSDTVHYFHCSQFEVTSRIECFFHLHISPNITLFFTLCKRCTPALLRFFHSFSERYVVNALLLRSHFRLSARMSVCKASELLQRTFLQNLFIHPIRPMISVFVGFLYGRHISQEKWEIKASFDGGILLRCNGPQCYDNLTILVN